MRSSMILTRFQMSRAGKGGGLHGLRGRTFQLAYAASLHGNLAGPYAATLRDLTRTSRSNLTLTRQPYAATLRDLTRTLRGNLTLTRQAYAATLRGPCAATLCGAYAYCPGERPGVSSAAQLARLIRTTFTHLKSMVLLGFKTLAMLYTQMVQLKDSAQRPIQISTALHPQTTHSAPFCPHSL